MVCWLSKTALSWRSSTLTKIITSRRLSSNRYPRAIFRLWSAWLWKRVVYTSVDQKMMEFFPEFANQINDPRKEQITIRDLLQMRSGYPWEETHDDLWAGLASGNYLLLLVGFPLTNDPGDTFSIQQLVFLAAGSDCCLEPVIQTLRNSPRSISYPPSVRMWAIGGQINMDITTKLSVLQLGIWPGSAAYFSMEVNLMENRSSRKNG